MTERIIRDKDCLPQYFEDEKPKRYVVPEGMFNAVMNCHNYIPDARVIRKELEAAVKWLSENPIVPNKEQVWGIGQTMDGTKDKFECSQELIEKWQRRMFLAPEPEVPLSIKAAIQGDTFTREQADRIISMINSCVPPEETK